MGIVIEYKYDIKNNTDTNLQKLINLINFCIIFINFTNSKDAPDYVLEKFNHWINVELYYVPEQHIEYRFLEYKDFWGEDSEEIKTYFYFLSKISEITYGTTVECREHFINDCINTYKLFGGKLLDLSSDKKVGIHQNLIDYVQTLFGAGHTFITAHLRDMQIDEL